MSRALDHFVFACTDLEALGRRFEALGFQVGGVNLHPFGTRNRIIQLADETFFELIAVNDPGQFPPPAPRHFDFPRFVQGAAARRAGMAMLVLKSEDARADGMVFKAAGCGDFEPFHFAREGTRPDGSAVQVAFTLAFAHAEAMPECGFFACQHHFPQNFWAAPAQKHANGALGVSRVTLVAENPSDHHIFLSAFVGERAMRSTSFGVEIVAGKGVVEIVSPEGFAFRYGLAAPASATPVFAGLEIAVAGASLPKGLLAHAGGFTAPPDAGCATALRFIERGSRAP